jgi:iron complex outermembrane receptor protein
LAVLNACTIAMAEERLPEVVVTAPAVRDETPAPRDPSAFASVIETRAAPTSVETLTEALAQTVGVQVRRFGGLGDFSTVSIRGFSPGQVQVYLDGVPLSRADNEVVNLSDLPLDAVDHVEVYRGTTPLVFAQSGPGGVVNVVTRRPGVTPLAAASASYGSFETRKTTLAGGASHGAFEGLVFAQYLGSEGDFRYTNFGNSATQVGDVRQTRINNAFDQGDLTTRLAYRDGPLTLALTTDSFVKSQGVPGRETLQSTTGHRDTNRELVNVALATEPVGPWSIGIDGNLFGLYQRQHFTAETDGAFNKTDVLDTSTTVGGQLVARGAVGTHNVPGVLVASSVERFQGTDAIGSSALMPGTSPPLTRTRLTLAGQDELLLLADRVSIVPSVRWEWFRDVFPGDPRVQVPAERVSGTRSQDFVTPRLGVRVDVGYGATLLANGGRSARIPNLTELFGRNGVITGEPHLRPETATSWDAGMRFVSPWTNRILTAATAEYAYFASDVDDIIVLVQSSVNVFRPMNISAATIRGHEVSVRLAFLDRLLLTTNYTHQDALDASGEPIYDGNRLPGRPANEAYARVELGWSAEHPLPWVPFGERLWPGRVYYDVDLIAENFLKRSNLDVARSRQYHGFGLDLTLPWHGLHLAWELKNATDDQTSDAADFPLPGRSMFVTLSYGFGAAGPVGSSQ